MTKTISVAKVAVALLVLFVICNNKSYAQETYGIADFSRSDIIPRDAMIDYWQLDKVNMSGDLLLDAGDMEQGATSGGCTYCPTGATCSCAGDSNITQETSLLYKNNSSLKYTSGTSGSIYTFFSFIAAPNTAYQLSFKYMGATGTEDMYFKLFGSVAPVYYNQATDVWQAGDSFRVYSSIPTTWTTQTVFIINDANAKTISVRFYNQSASKVFYLDDVQVQSYRDGTTIKGMKNNMTQTVSGNASFGQAPNAVSRPNQHSGAGNYGGYFDGSDSSLSVADNAVYEPQTYGYKFSWGCRDVNLTTHQQVIGKVATNQYGYVQTLTGGNQSGCYISKDGTQVAASRSYVGCVNGANGYSDSCACTYDGKTDGTSILRGYSRAAVASDTLAVYPIFNSPIPLAIGGTQAASNESIGSIGSCALWGKTLSAREAAQWISPHFPGPTETNGLYPTACVHTAPEASCSYDRCRDGTPNACQVQGTGTQAVFGAATELAPNNSFETYTGTDAVPIITGWLKTINGGTLSMYRPLAKHGAVAARMVTTNISGSNRVMIRSNCITVTPSTSYYLYVNKKTLAGDSSNASFLISPYSDGSCANTTGVNAFFSIPEGTSGSSYSTSASMNSLYVYVNNNQLPVGTDVVYDTISLRAKSYHTPWFHNAGTGTTSSTAKTYTLNNPLAEKRSDGVSAYTNGFCFGGWVWTPYLGSDSTSRYFGGTGGSTNQWNIEKFGSVNLNFNVVDSSNTTKRSSLSPTEINFTSNSWKYITGCTNNAGTITLNWYNTNNATWYIGSTNGAGTGIQNGQTSTATLGSLAAGNSDAYFHNFTITPYASPNPLPGWNNRPSNRPY